MSYPLRLLCALQVEVLTRDTERLAAENNHLHLRIIQETEKQEQFEREHLRKQKGLEDAVAELTFLKGSGAAKRAALAEENAGLRAKMRELLNELEAYQQAGSDGKNKLCYSCACICKKEALMIHLENLFAIQEAQA